MIIDNRAGLPAFKVLFLPKWFKSVLPHLKTFSFTELKDKLSHTELAEAAFFTRNTAVESYFSNHSLYNYWLTQTKFDNNYLYQLKELSDKYQSLNVGLSSTKQYMPDLDVIQKDVLFFVIWLDGDDVTALVNHENMKLLVDDLFSHMLAFMPLDIIAKSFNKVFTFFINELNLGDN